MFLYVDATAGGVLIQVLLGGFAGIGIVGRLVWSRVAGRFTSHDEATVDGETPVDDLTDDQVEHAA
jgi:hypothetical protein